MGNSKSFQGSILQGINTGHSCRIIVSCDKSTRGAIYTLKSNQHTIRESDAFGIGTIIHFNVITSCSSIKGWLNSSVIDILGSIMHRAHPFGIEGYIGCHRISVKVPGVGTSGFFIPTAKGMACPHGCRWFGHFSAMGYRLRSYCTSTLRIKSYGVGGCRWCWCRWMKEILYCLLNDR